MIGCFPCFISWTWDAAFFFPNSDGVEVTWVMWVFYGACRGLVSLNAIVCFYSIVQLVLCVVQVSSTGTFISSAAAGGSLLTFIFDSVLAYALIAAAAAAATAQAHLQDADYCQSIPGFCRKAQASIVLTFFAFAILAVCAALYPVRLLRMSK